MQPPWTAWHPRCRSPAHAVAWISRKTDGSAKRYSFHDQCTPCTAEEKYESGAAEYDFCSHLDAAPACTCSEGGGSWETWADGAGPLTREGGGKGMRVELRAARGGDGGGPGRSGCAPEGAQETRTGRGLANAQSPLPATHALRIRERTCRRPCAPSRPLQPAFSQ